MKINGNQHERLTQNINRLIKELNKLQKSVDELEQIKIELQKSQETVHRLAAVIRDSNDALTILDFKGDILAWNRGAERIYGWSEKEALRMNLRDILPENNKKEATALVKRLKSEERVESLETKRLTKSKKMLDVWLTATLLRNDKGKPVGIATTERDITEQKKEKQELRRLKEHCETEVEKKTRALMAVKEKSERDEKLVSLGKLAGMIGHELKNPLHVIRMNMYLINKHLDSDAEDDTIQKSLKTVEESIDESTRIIDNILTFSRTKEPQFAQMDLGQTIDNSIKKLKIPRNIRLIREIPKSLPLTRADGVQMAMVFFNIIKNAFQAMPKGGTLSLKAGVKEGMIEIRIADTGVGISKKNREKIFDPLFSTQDKGTGLGLSFCKSIITAHRGSIDLKTRAGLGTTFVIKLPIIKTD